MKKKPDVNVEHARSKDQIKALKKIIKSNECPFCGIDYLTKEHKKPILWDGVYWLATENRWPYKGAKVHLLFIHKEHITSIEKIKPEAWHELKVAVETMSKKAGIEGGTLIMRFGDSRYTGATVTHLHAQLICGDPHNPNREPVLARVG